MTFLTMEDSGFGYTANEQRLLVLFPASQRVLVPGAPLSRSALSLPDKP
jgi:hypothetical protein